MKPGKDNAIEKIELLHAQLVVLVGPAHTTIETNMTELCLIYGYPLLPLQSQRKSLGMLYRIPI